MAYRAQGAVQISNSSSSITPPAPSGVSADDDLIIILATNSASDRVSAWPTGFVDLGFANINPVNWAGNGGITAARKPAGVALPGSYAVTLVGSTTRVMAQMVAFSGRSGDAAVVGTPTTAAGSGGGAHNVALPGVTALAGDDVVWIAYASTNSAGLTFEPPGSYNEAIDTTNPNDAMSLAYRENVGAGATGTLTGTCTGGGGSDTCGFVVSLPVSTGSSVAPKAMNAYRQRRAA